MPNPDKPRTRRAGAIWTAVIAVIILAGLGAGVLTLSSKNETPKDAEGSIEIYAVSKRAFDIATTASGELEARNQELESRIELLEAALSEVLPKTAQN